ncbi:MAG: hypothetical protein ACREUW_14035 [Burkholderiales bacterium]
MNRRKIIALTITSMLFGCAVPQSEIPSNRSLESVSLHISGGPCELFEFGIDNLRKSLEKTPRYWKGTQSGPYCFVKFDKSVLDAEFSFCTLTGATVEPVAGVPNEKVFQNMQGCQIQTVGSEYIFTRMGFSNCSFACFKRANDSKKL